MSNIHIVKILGRPDNELDGMEDFFWDYWVAYDVDQGDVVAQADTRREVEAIVRRLTARDGE